MKIFGLIMIIAGIGLFIYGSVSGTLLKKENSVEQNITALKNTDLQIVGLIFLIIGILSRQGLWEAK